MEKDGEKSQTRALIYAAVENHRRLWRRAAEAQQLTEKVVNQT